MTRVAKIKHPFCCQPRAGVVFRMGDFVEVKVIITRLSVPVDQFPSSHAVDCGSIIIIIVAGTNFPNDPKLLGTVSYSEIERERTLIQLMS